jgi:hypothetical protein
LNPTHFQAHGSWFEAAVDATGFSFTPTNASGAVSVQFLGGNPGATVTATAATPATSAFLSAAATSTAQAGNASLAVAAYHDVYPGIDLQYNQTANQNLEYSFVVRPGGDPSRIRLAVQGSTGLSLDVQGNLVLHTAGGDLVSQAPMLFLKVTAGACRLPAVTPCSALARSASRLAPMIPPSR